jgi:RNA polymerase sigma-70 factor (ECF subfamily)
MDMSQPANQEVPGVLTPQGLCQDYAPAVCRYAAMLARSPSEAEDVAQEALFKAIRCLDRYDPRRGPVERWLWRIVVSAARDLQRRDARRLALLARLIRLWHEPSSTVEARALANVTNRELLAAVHALGWRDRTLLGLRYGADLDLAAVGAAVGLTEASAGRAVLRALSRLRKHLEVPDDQPD